MTINDILETGDPREIRRATAVSFHSFGIERKTISMALNVSIAFIDKWVSSYSKHGAESLLLQHKGSEGYLSNDEIKKVITHIRMKKNITLDYLVEYLEVNYGVIYCSKQSYYDLLHEGRRSWKKTEKENPKKDNALVEKRREEIKKS